MVPVGRSEGKKKPKGRGPWVYFRTTLFVGRPSICRAVRQVKGKNYSRCARAPKAYTQDVRLWGYPVSRARALVLLCSIGCASALEPWHVSLLTPRNHGAFWHWTQNDHAIYSRCKIYNSSDFKYLQLGPENAVHFCKITALSAIKPPVAIT